MAATGWRAGGGMGWSPYDKSGLRPSLNEWVRMTKGLSNKQKWQFAGSYKHNPLHVAYDATKGAGLATAIGVGNFLTRDYRQKPVVGLQTATHTNLNKYKRQIVDKIKPVGDRKVAAVDRMIDIPAVASRRVKDLSKNILLTTPKAMPYRTKKTYRRPPKTYKKATNRKNASKKRPAPKKGSVKSLQKDVKTLKQAINAINSTHTYRQITTGTLKSLIGRCNYVAWSGSNLANLETFTANLRFYDPASPGTLVTANPNTGSYARDVNIKDFHMKLLVRNNYQVPCRVRVYLCKIKNDSNDPVLTTYTNAITDQVINASIDETDASLYLTDIERVKETWNIDCVIDKVLEPGQEASTSHSTGSIVFDPSHLDLNTDYYQKAFKSFQFVIRLEGVLGHDTSANEQTLMLAGIDTQASWKAVIQYNSGGADLDDIYIADNRGQSFTNGGVVSLKPVADNIAYSVS